MRSVAAKFTYSAQSVRGGEVHKRAPRVYYYAMPVPEPSQAELVSFPLNAAGTRRWSRARDFFTIELSFK